MIKKANGLWGKISPEMKRMNGENYTFDANKLKDATELMQLTSDISAKLDYANALNLNAQNKSKNNNNKEITQLLTLCTKFANDARKENDALQNSTQEFRDKFGYLLTDAYKKTRSENLDLQSKLNTITEKLTKLEEASKLLNDERKTFDQKHNETLREKDLLLEDAEREREKVKKELLTY